MTPVLFQIHKELIKGASGIMIANYASFNTIIATTAIGVSDRLYSDSKNNLYFNLPANWYKFTWKICVKAENLPFPDGEMLSAVISLKVNDEQIFTIPTWNATLCKGKERTMIVITSKIFEIKYSTDKIIWTITPTINNGGTNPTQDYAIYDIENQIESIDLPSTVN